MMTLKRIFCAKLPKLINLILNVIQNVLGFKKIIYIQFIGVTMVRQIHYFKK